ncbi:MAG: hypothetical protein PVSMB4_19050 [Ktedonobacterales bacterium]
MSTSAPQNPTSSTAGQASGTPAGATPPERVYVTLPPPGNHGSRSARNAQQPLLQWLSQVAAGLLCLSLPGASGVIMVLLLVHAGAAGFAWLWIPMIIFVEIIAVGCAIGIWREVTGWSSPRDYQRS